MTFRNIFTTLSTPTTLLYGALMQTVIDLFLVKIAKVVFLLLGIGAVFM